MCFDCMPLFGGPHVTEETTHFLVSSLIISTKWIDLHETGFHQMALRKQVKMKGHEKD